MEEALPGTRILRGDSYLKYKIDHRKITLPQPRRCQGENYIAIKFLTNLAYATITYIIGKVTDKLTAL